MASNRIGILQSMVDQNPSDTFARYGLAMEYANSGNLEEAVRQYRTLLQNHEDTRRLIITEGRLWRGSDS